MNKFLILLIVFFSLNIPINSQTNTFSKGDKKFAQLKYQSALKSYLKLLKKNPADSVKIQEKIAACYSILDNTQEAEIWYKKAIQNGEKSNEIKFALAQVLRQNGKYDEVKNILLQMPENNNAKNIVAGLNNLKDLMYDNSAYQIQLAATNKKRGEFASGFLNGNTPLIATNCNCNTPAADWKSNSFNKLNLLKDSTKLKAVKGLKIKGFKGISSATFSPENKELIFAASKFVKNEKGRQIQIKLYSTTYPIKSKKDILELPFNSEEYSNAHPAISLDGKTLYFVSDRSGGFGGSDIYVVKKENGKWTTPKNLGSEINTPQNETYPFIASDNTLYFSSNGREGLGGYDIYKSIVENGKWLKAENLNTPINTNANDFAFVLDSTNKTGYFSSDRTGGKGKSDIYKFNFDATKLSYKILIKVREAGTLKILSDADATIKNNKFSANKTGEILVSVKGSDKTKLDVFAPGYKPFSQIVTRKNAGTITVELTPDIFQLNITIKEKESGFPLRDVSVSLKDAQKNIVTFVSDSLGLINTPILSGGYTVFSFDYDSLSDQFNTSVASNGIVNRNYQLSKKNFTVSIPLLANCFSSQVNVTDLKTGEVFSVKPNVNGDVRLELHLENQYVIEHNLRKDTISTHGLFPGDEIEGPCKFKVGQKWIVNNVFYDYNKSNIRTDAAHALDDLVRIMNEHPSLQIQLASYTDCRGSKKYNDLLSLSRAKAAIDYIVAKGIRLKRLVAAGFGERKPVNNCTCEPSNKSECTEEQHQANRRTEVKVLKY